METQANWHSELASAIVGIEDRRHSARVARTLFLGRRSLGWSGMVPGRTTYRYGDLTGQFLPTSIL